MRSRADLPYIPALDGIRGVAVLGILLFHAGHLVGGWLGVDLFLVLSGFLITSILLSEYEATEKISISRFWIRRARRLIPGLYAALIGVSLYALLVAHPEELARIRADGIATVFYVANWHAIYAGHDYWEMFGAPSPLDHTWSLAIEEQFYLLWPPLAYWVLRRSPGSTRSLAALSLGFALVSAAWMIYQFDASRGTARLYFGTDTRAAATLLGAALAAILRPGLRRSLQESRPGADAVAWIGIATLGWAWGNLDGQDPAVYQGGLFILSISGAGVIGGAVLAPQGLAARLFSLAPLRMLGVVSYGVYLWHWPIYLVLTPGRVPLDGWALTIVRIAVTLVVSAASYRFLERPIRFGALTSQRAGALLFAGTFVVCASLVAATYTPEPFGAEDAPLAEGSFPAEGSSSVEDSVDILIVGDSLGQAIAPGFRSEARRRGLRTKSLSRWGCGIIHADRLRSLGGGSSFDLAPCLALSASWRSYAATHHPDTVLILEGWPGAGEKRFGGSWHQPCTTEFDTKFGDDLTDTVHSLQASGSLPAIVTTAPPILSDLNAIMSEHWPNLSSDQLKDLFQRNSECQNRVRREVAEQTGALLLDLDAYLCPHGRCRREMNGVRLRSDGLHFRGPGARLISTWLLDQIEALKTPQPRSAPGNAADHAYHSPQASQAPSIPKIQVDAPTRPTPMTIAPILPPCVPIQDGARPPRRAGAEPRCREAARLRT